MNYTNAIRDRNNSEYVRTAPFDGAILTFSAKTARPTIVGKVVPMVNLSARLSAPAPITPCDTTMCDGSITEAVAISVNFRQGSDFAALRTELLRVFDIAVQDYNFADGIVPPTNASFEGA